MDLERMLSMCRRDQWSVGDLDFSPSWEWLANHGHCFEMVFIMTDDGFAHVVLIQNSPMQNRLLRALCLTYATAWPGEAP